MTSRPASMPLAASRASAGSGTGARGSSGPFLPALLLCAVLLLGGLVIRDHLLPVLRPAVATAASSAGPWGDASATDAEGTPLEHRDSPLLRGEAADRALQERRRDELLDRSGATLPPEEIPPAL